MADPLLKKYHLQGFWIKICSSLAFTIFSVYISPGDSTGLFFTEGTNIFKLVMRDFENIKLFFDVGADFDESQLSNSLNAGYFHSESNYFIAKLVAFLTPLCFSSYLIMNLFFSMISFSGVWKLYRFFYEQYPHLHKKMAIAIIYLPTFIFWSSGILKDPLCTGMLGWLTYALYSIFEKRTSILKNVLIAIIAGYVLGTVKSYILVSYLPFFFVYLILHNLKKIKSTGTRFAVLGSLIIIGIVGVVLVSDRLQVEVAGFTVDKLSESVKNQQRNFINMADLAESSFSLGVEFDGSPGSMLKMAPAAITATLFRPFLWESKKLSTLLSSLESLALMLFTIFVFFKAGPFLFFGSVFKDPMILYCFFFSILFALFVGATTLNFGTLVRYKIPCIPFYIIALMLIYEKYLAKKDSLSLAKKAVPVKPII
ncbi:MAG: hypothetical protein ACOYKE_13030 [Ferruginibacter sp.]